MRIKFGTTSNDGIEKLLEENFSEEELDNIVQVLTNFRIRVSSIS